MANPLAAINQARYRPGGVTTMLPQALLPPVQRRVVPRQGGGGGSLADRAYRQQQESGQWAAQGAGSQQEGPGLRGLGWIIGNPVSKAAFGALSVLDYPRAAVNATLRETLDALDLAEAGDDTGFDWGELWRNTKEHKGFGELVVEPALGDDANIWLKRGLGLAGDIATDPFSWATLGTKAIPGAAARSSYAGKLMAEQGRVASEAAAHLAKVKEMERFLPMAELIDPATAAAARHTLEASDNLLPGLWARQEALGGSEALEQIGRRGVGGANAEQLAAMGIDKPALRVGSFMGMGKGVAVPHTEAMARFMGRATGPVREAIGKSALATGMRKLRTPEGVVDQDLTTALNRIVTGRGGGTIEEALGTTRLNDLMRLGHGRYKGMAARELDTWWQKVKELSPDERARLIRAGEEDGVQNVMTELAPKMIRAAKDMGVELPTMEGHYVMPHIFSREAFRFLQKLKRNGDAMYEPFKTAIGFSTRDLLQEGNFVQKRLLRPALDAEGVLQPLELKIGDQVVRIEKGSIAELEQKLGGLLRSKGFKGNLYESNPYQAWKQYINSQSRDVAIRYASPIAEREGLEGLGRAGAAPKGFDPYGGRKTVPTDEGELRQVIELPESQRPANTEFWELKPDDEATKARNELLGRKGELGKEQLELAKGFETQADVGRAEAAKEINAMQAEAWKPITETLQGFHEGERAAAGRADIFSDLMTEMQTRQSEIDTLMAESQDEIDRLQREIATTTSAGSRRARRRMDQLTATREARVEKSMKALTDLQEAYDTLQRVNRETADTAFADAVRFSTEQRATHMKTLERRAKEAKDRFEQAQDELVGRQALGKGQRGSRWVTVGEKRQAERIVNNPENIERHNRLVRRAQQLEREETRLRAEAAGMDQQATQLRHQAQSRELDEAQQQALTDQADKLETQAYNRKVEANNKLYARAQGDNPNNLVNQVKRTAYAKAKRTLDIDAENRAALDRATIEAHNEIPMSRAQETQDIEQAARAGGRQRGNTLPALRNAARSTMEERDAFRAALSIEEHMPERARTIGEELEQRGAQAVERLGTPEMQQAGQLENRLNEVEAEIRQALREGPGDVRGGEKPTWTKNPDGTQTAVIAGTGSKAPPPFGGSGEAAAATILEREIREQQAGFFAAGLPSYMATSEPRDDIARYLAELGQPPSTRIGQAGPDLTATITEKTDGWHVTWEGGVKMEGGGRRQKDLIADTEEEAKAYVERLTRPVSKEAKEHAAKVRALEQTRDEIRQQIESRPVLGETRRAAEGEKRAAGRRGDALRDVAQAERVLAGQDEQAWLAMRAEREALKGPPPPPTRTTEMGLEVRPGDTDLTWTKQAIPAEEAAAGQTEYDEVAAQLRQTERDLRIANEYEPLGGGRTEPPDERPYSSSVRKKAFDPETETYKPKSAEFAGKETKQATPPWWSEEQYLTSSPAINIEDAKKAAEIEARTAERLGREPRTSVVQKPFPSRSIEGAYEPPMRRPPEPKVERPTFPRENPGEKPIRYRLATPDGTPLHTIEATKGGWHITDPNTGEVTFAKTLGEAKANAFGSYRRNVVENSPELTAWKAHVDDLTAKRDEAKQWLDQNSHLRARRGTTSPTQYVAQVGDQTVRIERSGPGKYNLMFPDGRVETVSAKRPYLAIREANKIIKGEGEEVVSTVDTAGRARLRQIADFEEANPKVVARVREAEGRIKKAKAAIEELDRPLPPGQVAHPAIEDINRQTSQQLDQALDVERNITRTEAEYQPKFAEGEAKTLSALDAMENIESGALGDTSAEVRAAMDRLDTPEVREFYANQAEMAAIDKKLQRPKPRRLDKRYRERIAALKLKADELGAYFEHNTELAERVRADEAQIARGVEGTRGPSHAGIALGEAAEARPKIAAARREVEGQQEYQRQLIEQRQAIDPELAQMHEYFYDSLYDQADMKAAHDELAAKVKPLKRRDAEAMLTKKKAGRPAQSSLALVESGAKPGYEAQPLHTVVQDMDALIALDPLGNDVQITKAKAAVSATEKALTKITKEGDIPARQARNIVDEANKGKLAPVVMAQLRDGWSFIWDGGDMVISDAMRAKYLNISSTVESKRFGPLLTAFTDFFKTYATLTPGFHVRNGMSAIFMNASEGVTVREQFQGLQYWKQFIRAEDPQEWLIGQPQYVQDAFAAVFSSGTGGQFTEAGVSELRSGGRRFTEKLYANKLTKANQRFGQNYVEGPARLALAMNTTRQKGATMVDAMNRITRVHFDYSQISKFDATMKRFIPFWTFMSRNLPLQITQMWTKPGTYLRWQSLQRNLQLGAEELPWMPEYIKNLGGFSTGGTVPGGVPGTEEGSPLVWMPPFPQYQVQEDLRRTAQALSGQNVGQMFSDVNPAFTAPFEFITGTDIYTGKTYGPEDWSKVNPAGMPLAAAMAPFGLAKKGGDGNWYMQDKAMQAMMSVNPIMERQSRLLPNLLTESPAKSNRQLESYLRFLGIPLRTLTQDQMRSEQTSRYYDQRDKALERAATGG